MKKEQLVCVYQSFLIIIFLLYTNWKVILTFFGGLDVVIDIFIK